VPRVHTKLKSKAGKPRTCDKCGEPILPGTRYYEWSFRYAGTRRRHSTCGYPRGSELTTSRLSEVYAAIEAVEDESSSWESEDDARQSMEAAVDTVREVASEYEQAAESFGQAGPNQERYEALDEFADELESWEPEPLDDFPLEDDQGEPVLDDDGEAVVDLESWRSACQGNIPQCPI